MQLQPIANPSAKEGRNDTGKLGEIGGATKKLKKAMTLTNFEIPKRLRREAQS
jgi:hypothetical protein